MDSVNITPLRLQRLASYEFTKLLQHSVHSMNRLIVRDIQQQYAKIVSPASKSKSIDSKSVGNETNGNESPISQYICAKATLHMMRVRKYLMIRNSYDGKMGLSSEIIQEIISSAIETGNLGMIRLVVCEWNDILDFRALDLARSNSSNIISPSEINSSQKLAKPFVQCHPPDEFDWFSRDRLGKIINMSEVCEIFAILGMSQCASNIKELYISARRAEYWACPPDKMELIVDVLLQMTKLTTLVLRGCCDDYILKLIGRTATGLKELDISGSHFVTDSGLKSLLFKEGTENEPTYLIKAYVEKNLHKMNPLVSTLEFLDFSWTSVTSLARKMVHNLPGSFMFKRIFSRNESFAYGHHIFLREKPLIQIKIPAKAEESDWENLEKMLEPFIGSNRGAKTFLKLVEQHPWKNDILYLYKSTACEKNSHVFGIITPNDDERRVYGIIHFQDNFLSDLYTVYPINLNLLGDACPKLQGFRGTITDTWKMQSSVLPELVVLEMFSDPSTIKSILECAPNLKKVKIRVLKECLTDDHIISLSTFMCCRTLEELWISSGTFKATTSIANNPNALNDEDESEFRWQTFNEVRSNYYSAENPPRASKSLSGNKINENNANVSVSNINDEEEECLIQDLVQLGYGSLQTILSACQKLERVGDLGWWTPIIKEDVEKISKELRLAKRNVALCWGNQIFPTNDLK